MNTAIIEKRRYTYEDYLKTPDGERYELIGGKLIMTPAPVIKHQKISIRIGSALEKFVRENNLGEVFAAPCDVYLDEGNVVQPDILFVSKEREGIITERNVQGAPDLVIEIISDWSVYRDMVQKKRLYARYGVKEYWIALPEESSIEVYLLEGDIYQLYKIYNKDDILNSPYLTHFNMELKEIF